MAPRLKVHDPATEPASNAASGDDADLPGRLGLPAGGRGLPRDDASDEERIARTRRIVPALAEIDPSEIDVVLSVLHGGVGEGGAVPAMLDLLGLPYVGSDPIASAVTLDKEHTKRVLQAARIPVAADFLWLPSEASAAQEGCAPSAAHPDRVATANGPGHAASVVDAGRAAPSTADSPGAVPERVCRDALPGPDWVARLGGYPAVVKPLLEGSTVGLSIVKEPAEWAQAWTTGAPYAHPTRGLLVERYIAGKEITVAVVGDEVLPVVEIVPRTGFYDFEHKYTKGETEYRVPAPLAEATTQRLQELALRAFRALGCRDLARIDFRLSELDEPYCLELNTLPGMTETSLVPMASRTIGIEFGELLELLCRIALSRNGGGYETR
ncbi:MAG: hypothetical protein R3E12_17370 [Candidatus Eisenbacteria bacterium]